MQPQIVPESGFNSRFRSMIDRAGGPSAVAKASKVPLPSINSYLKGSEPTASRALLLAKACNVSLEWLITGEGPTELYDIPLFQDEMLNAPVNFYLLLVSIRVCREAYEKVQKPTLKEVFNYISGPYKLHASIADAPLEFKSPAEVTP